MISGDDMMGEAVLPVDLEQALVLLQRERELAETLHAIGASILRGRDLQAIVQEVTDACTKLCGARFGAFFYNSVQSSGEELLLYTLSGAPRSAFEHFGHPRATAIFRPTFEGTKIMRIDDVTMHPDFGKNAPHNGMPTGHLPVRSYLAVPVLLADRSVAGGLFFGHPEPGVFTEDHERLVVGVASHAAIAIENVRLLDRARWAKEQAEERAHAARALEYIADGVFLIDTAGFIRVWNPAAERITGVSAADAVMRGADATFDRWEHLQALIPTVPHEGGGDDLDPKVLPLSFGDDEVWISIHGAEFSEGTVYAFRDVTGERRLEEMREDMIATVSHELRTPLASVYGAAVTLQRTDIEVSAPTRTTLVNLVAQECARLSGIIDDFLLASSVGHGATLRTGAADLRTLVADAAVAARARSTVDLEVVASGGDDPVYAEADEAKLRQVVSNLVDNAMKYGASGSRIEIGATRDGGRTRLWVRDFGPGIPADEAERVFERFYRLDPHLRTGINGTGLGLYISRELVQRMGGSLTVRSEPDVETTFEIELPAHAG